MGQWFDEVLPTRMWSIQLSYEVHANLTSLS